VRKHLVTAAVQGRWNCCGDRVETVWRFLPIASKYFSIKAALLSRRKRPGAALEGPPGSQRAPTIWAPLVAGRNRRSVEKSAHFAGRDYCQGPGAWGWEIR